MAVPSWGACGMFSPHRPKRVKRNGWFAHLQVRCNRPTGHDGNHAHSTARYARRWEWTQDDQIVR